MKVRLCRNTRTSERATIDEELIALVRIVRLGRRDMRRSCRRKQGGGEEPVFSGIQTNWLPIGSGVRQCFQPAVSSSSLHRHCLEKPVRESGYLVSQ